MQRYTYKLLKYSELEGQYRGGTHGSDEKLEQKVNQELNTLAEQGWVVQNFAVHYTGGRLIYTVLLSCETSPEVAVQAPEELPKATEIKAAAEPELVESKVSESKVSEGQELTLAPIISIPLPVNKLPQQVATISDNRPKRQPNDATTELKALLEQGPTIGERAAELQQNIQGQYGKEYFRRALASFDANLKARSKQENVPAEAIAIRALRHRDEKHEPTFQFALCWLSENGYATRPLATVLAGTIQLSLLDDAPKAPPPVPNGNIPKLRPTPQAIHEQMASRFDLPDRR